jgi:asparagine synthase (glutamine-hydrolysing)
MCGITGYYNRNGLSRDAVRKTKQMLSVLTHRGPDGSGIYRDKNSVLGHNRLSIIDPEGGVQPMSNEDDTLWITFNGEVFNYPELRAELTAKGHKFKTNSDTEVILHLYEDKKEDCVNYLNGQFAFAIRDITNDELFLARDHSGYFRCFIQLHLQAILFLPLK